MMEQCKEKLSMEAMNTKVMGIIESTFVIPVG